MSKTLTQYLKEVSKEQVTIIVDGNEKQVTRTEALARKMFLMAMGGIEELLDDEGNVVQMVHKPDYRVAKSIREFTEGKANIEPPKETKGKAKAGRYDSEVAGRLSDRLGPSSALLSPQRPRPVSKGIQA